MQLHNGRIRFVVAASITDLSNVLKVWPGISMYDNTSYQLVNCLLYA